MGSKINRKLPTQSDDITHEYIHPSVLQQTIQNATLQDDIKKSPSLVPALLPLEEEVKALWKPSSQRHAAYQSRKSSQDSTMDPEDTQDVGTISTKSAEPEDIDQNSGRMKSLQNSSIGTFLKELLS